FVTNSPVLSFTVNGHDPGATLPLDSRKDKIAQIHAVAESQLPYQALEIVANGAVVAQASPGGLRHRAEVHLEFPVRQSCWLAARVFEDKNKYRGLDFETVHVPQGTLVS